MTLPASTIDLSQPTVTLSGVTVNVPDATLAAGTFDVGCFGVTLATLTVQLSLVGTAEIGTATVDTVNRTVTLTDSTLDLVGSSIVLGGGLGTVPLPPISVPIPSFTISF